MIQSHQIIQRTFTLPDALHSLCPGAEWYSDEGTYETLVWLSADIEKPTLEQLELEVARLQEDWDAKEYQRWRDINYPSVGDQLDALYHAGLFPPEMAARIKAIKDAFPKPTNPR